MWLAVYPFFHRVTLVESATTVVPRPTFLFHSHPEDHRNQRGVENVASQPRRSDAAADLRAATDLRAAADLRAAGAAGADPRAAGADLRALLALICELLALICELLALIFELLVLAALRALAQLLVMLLRGLGLLNPGEDAGAIGTLNCLSQSWAKSTTVT